MDQIDLWQDHWKGMPEYNNEEIKPHKTLLLHFRCENDYQMFAELTGQRLTEKTKSAWFPKKEKIDRSLWRYVDGNV